MIEEKPVTLKTAVNTRSSLDTRCAPIQSPHQNSKTIATSFNTSGSSGASGTTTSPRKDVLVGLPKRQCEETSYTAAMNSTVRSAADVPARGKEPHPKSDVSARAFDASSTMHVATSALLKNGLQEQFFSHVRQIERIDDDGRKLGKGSQRTVDIMIKRETHEDMQPPPVEFIRTVRRSPQDVLPVPNPAQQVICTHLGPQSTSQYDFKAPASILPRIIDQKMETQRRVLSETGSAHDLFFGTPKARADVPPGYMGHCPQAASNIHSIKGDGVEILRPHAKCAVNLATSAGCNLGRNANEPRPRSPASRASTMAGYYLEQAASASKLELSLNRREHRIR